MSDLRGCFFPPWTVLLKVELSRLNNDCADDAESAGSHFAVTLALATSRDL
jgi:hypothetical protein